MANGVITTTFGGNVQYLTNFYRATTCNATHGITSGRLKLHGKCRSGKCGSRSQGWKVQE